MVRMVAGSSFSRGMGTGSGLAIGLVAALAGIVTLAAGWHWLSEPIAAPKPPTVGNADQAKRIALNALRKRGVARLAREARAAFSADDNQWMVYGPAETDDGRLVQVNVLLSVGTVQGVQKWKLEIMEIDGKPYLGR